MNAAAKPDLERMLRLLFRFLDLSRDLDRNRDDALFAEDSGRITYVLDENVFEIFVRPFDQRGEQVSLHSHSWAGSRDRGGQREAHTSFAAQAALLTSEYLFSGELPGQTDVRLFMTEWHSWELARRVQALNAEYERKLTDINEEELAKPFEALRMVLRNVSDGETGAGAVGAVDPDLEQDIVELRDASLKVRKSFISTRLAVKILADSRDVEPAEQLDRIVTNPIRGRIHRLHLVYRPRPENRDATREAVERDAQEWMRRLERECRERGIEVVKGPNEGDQRVRIRAALWDDARSLALIRWAAVHGVKAGERLVFVTADSLLFDTYRKWYAGLEPHSAEYLEPFILRRMIQYAPIFNLSDSRNVLGDDVRAFFGQLQSVLEITMLPLNLSRLKSTAGEEVLTRMREMTALRLLDGRPIRDDPHYADLTRALEVDPSHFDALLEQWRRLERSSLGLAGEYVRARLSEKQRKLEDLKLMTETDEASAKVALRNYVGRLIERLLEGSRAFWLPLAREFIDSWEPRPGHSSRAPIPFQLQLSVGSTTISLGQILDRRLNANERTPIVAPDAWTALLEAPDIVFAIAACLALVSDDWSDADHFAEMAQRADQDRSSRPQNGLRSQSHELRYLNALTRRFRIGGLAPPLNVDSLSKVRQGYAVACQLLEACVEHHERHEDEAVHRLRMIRALSERAALRLFYAAGLTQRVRFAALMRLPQKDRDEVVWADHKQGTEAEEAARQRRDEARRAVAEAEVDLRRCLQCEAVLPAAERRANAGLFEKLEQQFLVNIAAAAVLARMLESSVPAGARDGEAFDFRVANHAVARRIRRLLDSMDTGAPALFQAELLAFLSLWGDTAAHDRLKAIEGASASGKTLSLDLALLDAIRAAAKDGMFVPQRVAVS